MTAIVSHLTGHDLRRAMSAVQTLAAHDSGSASFGRPGESLSDADRSAFDRHFREHPLVRFHGTHPGGPTQRISDCQGARALRDSAVFADYCRRLGINFVMALPLRIDAAVVVSVVFNRSRADCTDRERALLDTMRRPLAALYRGFVARDEAGAGLARLQDLAVGQGWQVVRVSLDDRIVEMTEPAQRLLAAAEPQLGSRPSGLRPRPRRGARQPEAHHPLRA